VAGLDVLAKAKPVVSIPEVSGTEASRLLLLVASKNETLPVGATVPPAQTVPFSA